MGDRAYMLELPPWLEGIHDVLHVFYLWKCLIEEPSILPLDELQVDGSRRLVEESEALLK